MVLGFGSGPYIITSTIDTGVQKRFGSGVNTRGTRCLFTVVMGTIVTIVERNFGPG